MKILIDSRISSGLHGGIEQSIIGIADAFRILNDPEIEFIFLVKGDDFSWIKDHLPRKAQLIFDSTNLVETNKYENVKRIIRKVPFVYLIATRFREILNPGGSLPSEPSFIKEIQPDLIHFPTQFGFRTTIPSVYQPHDLLHFHYPQFFSKTERVIRKIGYGAMLRQARAVVVGNEWTKRDFIENYPEVAMKIHNVPLYPQDFFPEEKSGCLPAKFGDGDFFFYPASGWEHKNHSMLLKSIAQVINSGHNVNLVLSGLQSSQIPRVSELAKRLGIENHLEILQFVSPGDLASIYKKAGAVIIPSLFESASFPIWEAFKFDVPVLCSNVTSLPEQAKASAIFFNPFDLESISKAITDFLTIDNEIQQRIRNGSRRVALFSALNTAQGFRFCYRRSLDLNMDVQDNDWLDSGIRF